MDGKQLSGFAKLVDNRMDMLERRIATSEKRLESMLSLEKEVKKLNVILDDDRLKELPEVFETVKKIAMLMNGNPDLGVKPIREILNEHDIAYQRAKWTYYILTAISGGSFLAVLNLIFGG